MSEELEAILRAQYDGGYDTAREGQKLLCAMERLAGDPLESQRMLDIAEAVDAETHTGAARTAHSGSRTIRAAVEAYVKAALAPAEAAQTDPGDQEEESLTAFGAPQEEIENLAAAAREDRGSKTISPDYQREFEDCYRSMSRLVFAFLQRYTRGDIALAEDLVQETFVTAVRNWHALHELTDKQRQAWIYRVAARTAVDVYSQPTSEELPTETAELMITFVPIQDREAVTGIVSPRQELADALEQLSPKLREVVLLDIELNLGERSVAEIAEILGIGRAAAYARRKRAYAELRRLLPTSNMELEKMQPAHGRSTQYHDSTSEEGTGEAGTKTNLR